MKSETIDQILEHHPLYRASGVLDRNNAELNLVLRIASDERQFVVSITSGLRRGLNVRVVVNSVTHRGDEIRQPIDFPAACTSDDAPYPTFS